MLSDKKLMRVTLMRDPGVITSAEQTGISWAIENTEALASSPRMGREGQDWHPAHVVRGQEPMNQVILTDLWSVNP